MVKSWSPVLLVLLGVIIGNVRVTRIGHDEAKAEPPVVQKSDRQTTLADYGFHELADGCSLVIVSPTVVKISDVPGVGGCRFFPTGNNFADALDRLGRKRKIQHVVPITGTLGDWRRRNDWRESRDSKSDDSESRTIELIVIVDDPRAS